MFIQDLCTLRINSCHKQIKESKIVHQSKFRCQRKHLVHKNWSSDMPCMLMYAQIVVSFSSGQWCFLV